MSHVQVIDVLAHVDVGKLDTARAGAGAATLHRDIVQIQTDTQVGCSGGTLAAEIAAHRQTIEVTSHDDAAGSRIDEDTAAHLDAGRRPPC